MLLGRTLAYAFQYVFHLTRLIAETCSFLISTVVITLFDQRFIITFAPIKFKPKATFLNALILHESHINKDAKLKSSS